VWVPKRRQGTEDSQALVVVLVAQCGASGVQDIPDTDIGHHSGRVDSGIECERVATDVVTVDLAEPLWVLVGVEAEGTVNEGVVEEEEWVSNRGLDVRHDSSDTIVAIGVVTKLNAPTQTGVVRVAGAEIDIFLVAVACLTAVTVTCQTVNNVAIAGADVKNQVGELTIPYTLSTESDASKPSAREDGRLGKAASIAGFVEPRQRPIEATFIAHKPLKQSGESSVPEEKFGVAVDVGCEPLVQSNKVLIAILCLGELARGGPGQQALDTIHEFLLVTVGHAVPLYACAYVCACATTLIPDSFVGMVRGGWVGLGGCFDFVVDQLDLCILEGNWCMVEFCVESFKGQGFTDFAEDVVYDFGHVGHNAVQCRGRWEGSGAGDDGQRDESGAHDEGELGVGILSIVVEKIAIGKVGRV
jgi:hypothetical protein